MKRSCGEFQVDIWHSWAQTEIKHANSQYKYSMTCGTFEYYVL